MSVEYMDNVKSSYNLYMRLGGDKTIDDAIGIFYNKIMGDSLLYPFFKNTDIEQLVAKQKSFLTLAFGGPSDYTYWQRGLRNAHRPAVDKGLKDLHFDLVVDHLEDTMKELSISNELIGEVKEIVESTRKHVLNKPLEPA